MKSPFNRFVNFWKPNHTPSLKEALDTARTRLFVMASVFSFVIFIIAFRLFDLTVLRQESPLVSVADEEKAVQPATGRADILDCNGELVATTLVTSSLFANPANILDAREAAQKLSRTFPGIKEEELYKRLTSGKTFIWIQRHLTPAQKVKVLELGLPGLEFVVDYRRVYPHGNLLSHVIGFTDIDNRGLAGIEKGMDERLRTNPDPLVLNIDLRFQHIMRNELQDGMRDFGCSGASGILMDMKGNILAMVSLPDFNPNQPLKSTEDERFNKTTLGIYEMGSILKIANTALGLESGAVTLGTRFNTGEPIKVGRFLITDYKVPPGIYNVAEVFVRSSNRGSIRIALAAGVEKQKEFLAKLGYMSTPSLEIPEVGAPSIPRNWGEATTITASYGYGFSISQLQVLTGVATIVGGGLRVHPTLLKNGNSTRTPERVVSESTSRKVLQLMRLVVQQGTSRKADIPGFFVAGKTGTANLLQKGGYNRDRVSTSFISVLGEDSSSPRYIMITRLYDPQRLAKTYGFNSAGWNVVPVSRRIWERIAHLVGLEPRDSESRILDPFFDNSTFYNRSAP